MNERATAYHEAGHAVARFVLGRRIDRVSIVPDDESLGHVRGYVLRKIGEDWNYTLRDVQLLEDEIVSILAGAVAETRLTGRENPVGAQHDRDNAAMLAVHLEGPEVAEPYLNYLEARARALIGARWSIVEALAAELLERKVLSGVAARRTMRRASRKRA